MPWNFKQRSETIRRYGASALPVGSTLTDWPLDYAELEPYYEKVEFLLGVSGRPGTSAARSTRAGTSSRARGAASTHCLPCGGPGSPSSWRTRRGGSAGILPGAGCDPVAEVQRPARLRVPRLLHLGRLSRRCEGLDQPDLDPAR